MAKRQSKIQWYGDTLGTDGKAQPPVIAPDVEHHLEGLNRGEIYICDNEEDPVLFIRTNKDTVVGIRGSASVVEMAKYFLRKDQEDTAQEVITFLKGLRIAGHYISKVILSPEELEEADDAIMSVLKAVNTFIRKDKADATNFLLKLVGGAEFGNYEAGKSGGKVDAQGAAELLSLLVRGLVTASGIESADFSTGALGTGFTLKIDENGDSYIEVDRMLVRKVATFVELLIQKIRAVGGQIILSPATMNCSRVEEHDTFYRCFFENTDGEKTIAQEFVVGDQARCQTFNVKEGVNENVTNTYYWRLVVSVGDDYIDMSKTDCDAGSTVPQAGDDIVQLGNRTDATRQAAIVLAAYGNDAPYFKMYRGIDSYSLSGKEFISFSRTEVMIIADSLRFSTGESVKDYIDNATGNAITGVDVEYALGDSPTEAPQTGWSTTAPKWQAGKYMWQRTKTTTPKGSSYSEPTCIQGAKGDKGDQGLQGLQGEKGEQGIPGNPGKTLYTWIRYADNANGDGISNSPTGKAFIGFAYNKETATESNIPSDYTWSDIKGEPGVKGDKGDDGTQYYTWIKYSDNASGSGMYDTPKTTTQYIGIAVNKTSPTESNTPTDYTWSKFKGDKGDQGPQGIPGADGADGRTSYFHIKYSSKANPTSAADMTETPSEYIGTYVDYTAADSTDPSDYTWSRFQGIQGEKGDQGIPGTNGADGKTYYLHIAYANSADGSQGFSTTDSTNKLYIGQYTDTTQDDSPDHKKYSWTKIKGDTGKGVSALEEQYYLSTSNTTQTGGTWQTTCPAWESGKYIWTRTKVTWTDNTVTYTTPVLAEDINGVNEDLQNYKEEVEAKFEATNESITAAVESSKSYTDEKGEHILSETTSMIEVAKGEINLSVDTKIDNLQIGGRNLLRYSGLDEGILIGDVSAARGNHSRSIDTANTYSGHNSLKVTATGAGSNAGNNDFYWNTWTRDTTLNDIAPLVYTFYAKAGKAGTKMSIRCGHNTTKLGEVTLTTGWAKYELKLTPVAKWRDIVMWLQQADTVWMALPKVERGTKATDWTPAPEDTDASITELSSRIEVTEESIKNTVSKTEFNELSGTVSNHTSQITQLNNQITSKVSSSELTEKLKGYVTTTTYNNKMSSIDQSLSSITSRVSSTETEINTIDGELQDITERVSAAELKITDDAIRATVESQTKQIADEAVADLLIGGTNLVKGSATWNFAADAPQGTFIYSANADTSVPAGMVVQIKCTVGSGTTGFYNGPYVCVNGKRYTWSFYARANRAHTVSTVGFENGGQRSIALTTTRQRFTHTFTANSNGYKAFTFYNSWQSGDIVYIDSFKLEEGDKATDWDAHPDDAKMQGDNLLPGTKDFDGWRTVNSCVLDTSMMYQGLTPTKATSNYGYKGYDYTFVSGKFYTLSGWVRANVANTVRVMFAGFTSAGQGHFTIPKANTWYRFVYCFKCGDADHAAGTKTVRLESGSSISSSRPLWVCGLKLEEGITPSPWATALSEYSTTSEIKSSFEMTANGISLLGQEITLTGKVTFSMLASDAQNKVTTAQNTATSAQNKANSVDSALSSLKNDLGDLAYKDKVSDAMLDETVIVGGYLKTSLIDVDNLYVKHLNGADGVFTGSLQAATGSFSGEVNAKSGNIGRWIIDGYNLKTENNIIPDSPTAGGVGSRITNGGLQLTCGSEAGSAGILPLSSGMAMTASLVAKGNEQGLYGAFIGAEYNGYEGSTPTVIALELSAKSTSTNVLSQHPFAINVNAGFCNLQGIEMLSFKQFYDIKLNTHLSNFDTYAYTYPDKSVSANNTTITKPINDNYANLLHLYGTGKYTVNICGPEYGGQMLVITNETSTEKYICMTRGSDHWTYALKAYNGCIVYVTGARYSYGGRSVNDLFILGAGN